MFFFFFLPVNKLSSDASFEETTTPVAGKDAVVLSTRGISTNDTREAWRHPLGGGGAVRNILGGGAPLQDRLLMRIEAVRRDRRMQ